MDREDVKTFLIPNEMCRRAGIAGAFLATNEIGVYPSQFVRRTAKDAPSSYTTNTEAKMFQLRPNIILFHPILRRLVNESSGTFAKLQSELAGNNSQVDLLHYSVLYRSVIRACLENLKKSIFQASGLDKEELQNLITIFYSVECIWHLCEILFIKQLPGHFIKSHLLEWVRFHIPKYERQMMKLKSMNNGNGLETCPFYWDTVIGCLLQGRIEDVLSLLEMHSNCETVVFQLAVVALQGLPIFDNHVDVALTKFNLRRKQWLVETQGKIDGGAFLSETNLDYMMRLVVGEEAAWNKVQTKCEVWYEFLAGWTFYTEPTLKTYELGRFAKKCMGTHMKRMDRVLLAAMMQDINLIKELQSMNEHGWFVTHLTDLLYHSHHLTLWESNEEAAMSLRESFLLEYGTLLMGHSSMWQIALCYLDQCLTHGKATIELMLPRIAKSEAICLKLIHEANKRGLFATAQSIARVKCMYYIQHGHIGNAFVWALKGQDHEIIDHLVLKSLKHLKATYQIENEDLFAHLGKSMLASDCLMFIGKYYEYRQLLQNAKHKEAGKVLVSLVGSKFTPRFFWDVLLSDALCLLEMHDPVIDMDSSLIIINCLEEQAHQSSLSDKLMMLRMALERNMANLITKSKCI